jgi:hypothetical protein
MKHPFYVLSSGVECTVCTIQTLNFSNYKVVSNQIQDGNTPNTAPSGSSYDTSRTEYHIQEVKTFTIELNDASHSYNCF